LAICRQIVRLSLGTLGRLPRSGKQPPDQGGEKLADTAATREDGIDLYPTPAGGSRRFLAEDPSMTTAVRTFHSLFQVTVTDEGHATRAPS
jgi:hypothetical protein